MRNFFLHFIPVFSLFSCDGWCDTPYPYGKDPKGYLKKKEYILHVVKMSGAPTLAEYMEYFEDDLPEGRREENWAKLINNLEEKFLVIRSIKGNQYQPGEVVKVENKYKDHIGTVLGEEYLLFAAMTNGQLSYDKCDVASLERLNSDEKRKLLRLPLDDLINVLISKYYLGCLEEEIK